MLSKNMRIGLALLFGLALIIPREAFADRKGSGKAQGKSYNKPSHTRLTAKLLPVAGLPDEEMIGRVKYDKKSSAKGSEEKLEGKLKIPLPSSTLEISTGDLNLLFNTTFLLRIFQVSTTGAPPVTTMIEKGSCLLLLEKVAFDYEQGTVLEEVKAEYKAALKEKAKGSGAPELRKKIGDCDVVLASPTPGGPTTLVDGIPDIADGDVAEVYVLEQTTPGAAPTPGALLLTGTFQSKHDDDHDEDEHDDEDDDD